MEQERRVAVEASARNRQRQRRGLLAQPHREAGLAEERAVIDGLHERVLQHFGTCVRRFAGGADEQGGSEGQASQDAPTDET